LSKFNSQKRPLSYYPRRPSSTAVPKIGPRPPRRSPDGLISGPSGHSRSPHTPWGHCCRLAWSVVTCGGHPQPSRRPRRHFGTVVVLHLQRSGKQPGDEVNYGVFLCVFWAVSATSSGSTHVRDGGIGIPTSDSCWWWCVKYYLFLWVGRCCWGFEDALHKMRSHGLNQ